MKNVEFFLLTSFNLKHMAQGNLWTYVVKERLKMWHSVTFICF